MAKPLDVLGLALGATPEEIRARYRSLAQRAHPDRNGGDNAEFLRIQAAYEALKAKSAERGAFDDIFTETAREYKSSRE